MKSKPCFVAGAVEDYAIDSKTEISARPVLQKEEFGGERKHTRNTYTRTVRIARIIVQAPP
jgi:hypothetical protein